jgi:uncharacterized protein YqfB (UPF0267 family)
MKVENIKGTWSFCFLGEKPIYFKDFNTLTNHLTRVYWMFFPKGGYAMTEMLKTFDEQKRYGWRQRVGYTFKAEFYGREYFNRIRRFKETEYMQELTKIALAPEFHDLVKDGTKTQTIRYGRRDYPLGDAVFEGEYMPTNIEITELVYKKFKNLTFEDAELDGFNTLEELQTVLLDFYPDTGPDTDITLVKFKYKGE